MEDAPQAPAPAESQPASAVTIDNLDAMMATARQTADTEAASPTTDAPDRSPGATADRAAATSVQPAADEAAPEDDEGSSPADQPGKPSRMGRLREQLTQAEQAKRDIEARLNERTGADLVVRQKYAALLGTEQEKQQLVNVLANPNATSWEHTQARQRIAQMNQAAQELSPLYEAVQQDVFAHFAKGMESLRSLDGMDEAAHQSLFKAPSGVEALKLAHGIGQRAAEEQFKGEVASLKATVSDLKRKLAAAGTQPASGGGLAPGTANGLAGLLGSDGYPTEAAINAAKNGQLRQLQNA
jgi:hypothetical protein